MVKDVNQTPANEWECRALRKTDNLKAQLENAVSTKAYNFRAYIDANVSTADIKKALVDVFNVIVSHSRFYPEVILDKLIKHSFSMAENADIIDDIAKTMIKHNICLF